MKLWKNPRLFQSLVLEIRIDIRFDLMRDIRVAGKNQGIVTSLSEKIVSIGE